MKKRRAVRSKTNQRQVVPKLTSGLGRVLVGALLGLLIIGVLLGTVAFSRRSWSEIEPFRFLVVEEHNREVVGLVTFHYMVDSDELVVMRLPIEAEVMVPGDYGVYRLGAVARLSELERGNTSLLVKTVEQVLAMPFDRVIVWEGRIDTDASSSLIANALVYEVLRQDLTHLSQVADSLRLWWLVKQLGNEAITRVYLPAVVMREIRDIDGQQKFGLEKMQLDVVIEQHLIPAEAQLSDMTVVIENTVGVGGLATQWGRFFRHAGYDVLNIIDSQDALEASVVLVDPKLLWTEATEARIRKLVGDIEIKQADTSEYRSQIVLRLGQDLVNRKY